MSRDSKQKQCVFISGASRGIGLATALLLAEKGYRVYGTTRSIAALGDEVRNLPHERGLDLTFLEMDVNDDTAVQAAAAKVCSEVSAVDILINNAGFGSVGAGEDTGVEGARLQFETNYFGVLRVTNAFLPAMRKQGSGLIVNVSSLAALFSVPFQGQYVASKRALEGYSESLRAELKPFGIKVALILPNDIKTDINRSRVLFIPPGTPYGAAVEKVKERVTGNVESAAGPEIIAAAILKIAGSANPRMRYYAGAVSRFLSLIKRVLPDRTVLWLLGKRYGL